jgi:hypothetical protein
MEGTLSVTVGEARELFKDTYKCESMCKEKGVLDAQQYLKKYWNIQPQEATWWDPKRERKFE